MIQKAFLTFGRLFYFLVLPLALLAEPQSNSVIDLDPFSVEASNAGILAPNFRLQSPSFAYQNQPELPNGGLILALNFIDGYRELDVPGSEKWAGILQVPYFDARERFRYAWVVTYAYADGLWGYLPEAPTRALARFKLPLAVDQRFDLEKLAEIVGVMIQKITEEWPQSPISGWQSDDDDGMDYDYDDWDPMYGRIGGVGDAAGLPPEELVRYIYQYSGDALGGAVGSRYGPPEDLERRRFSFRDLFTTYPPETRHLSIAKKLLEPRWSLALKVEVTLPRPLPFLPHGKRTHNILFFAVGNRLLAYSPSIGVWMQNASADSITSSQALIDAMVLPGGHRPSNVDVLDLKD